MCLIMRFLLIPLSLFSQLINYPADTKFSRFQPSKQNFNRPKSTPWTCDWCNTAKPQCTSRILIGFCISTKLIGQSKWCSNLKQNVLIWDAKSSITSSVGTKFSCKTIKQAVYLAIQTWSHVNSRQNLLYSKSDVLLLFSVYSITKFWSERRVE